MIDQSRQVSTEYFQPPLIKKVSEIPLALIFLVCLTIFWLPYIISNILASAFYDMGELIITIVLGIFLCSLTIFFMFFIRGRIDRPTLKDYGLTTMNLKSNLILAIKLIFIIQAAEFLILNIAEVMGISFESEPIQVDLAFIINAVIIAVIFEETVYRMNASTLLARRIPIIWVAAITSTWFIAKHFPMWHFTNEFSLPALGVIVPMSIIFWIVVTYYFLKRHCTWIPVLVHLFNNGSIVIYYYLPVFLDFVVSLIVIIIGLIFIFIYGIPKVNKVIIEKISSRKVKITKKTIHYFGIFIGLSLLFLLTSEALTAVQQIDPLICIPVGLVLLGICIFTIIYVMASDRIIYVKD